MAKNYSEALEGIFTPETTVRSLLDNVRETLVTKYTDLEAAEKLAAEVEAENGDILKILLNITNTMAEVHNGASTKEDAMAIVAPMVKTIKEKCVSLGLTSAFSADNDISEVELDMLKQFITECRTLIEEHINALRDAEGSDLAGRAADLAHGADTEETDGEEAPEDDVEGAEESSLYSMIMNGDTEALEGIFSNMTERHQARSAAANNVDSMGAADLFPLYAKALANKGKTVRNDMKSLKAALAPSLKANKEKELGIKYTFSTKGGFAFCVENSNVHADHYFFLVEGTDKVQYVSVKSARLEAKKVSKKDATAQVKGAQAERKAAAKAARKAAKEGDVAAATEALIALLSYQTMGSYTPDGEEGIVTEAMISLMSGSDDIEF